MQFVSRALGHFKPTGGTLALLMSALVAACSGGGGSAAPQTPALGQSPPPPPPPTTTVNLQSETGVIYGTGLIQNGSQSLVLDVYQPDQECTVPRPFVIGIHGGGFTGGSRTDSNWVNTMDAITDRGFVGLSIDYRLAGDQPLVSGEFQPVLDALNAEATATGSTVDRAVLNAATAAFEDTVTAMRWAIENADERCLDRDRFAIWGSSAGAVTALHVGHGLDDFSIDRPTPLVIVDYWGRMLLRGQLDINGPPLFILHGTNDATVSFDEAVLLENEASSIGLSYSFYTMQNGPHGFGSVSSNRYRINGQAPLDVTLDFISDHLQGSQPLYETQTIPRN